MIPALTLVAALSLSTWPKDASKAPCEDEKQTPMDVCNAMTQAVKAADLDTLVGHTSAYARQRFSEKTKIALKGLHAVLVGVRCVRVDEQKEAQGDEPATALIWVYAPEGRSRDLPFLKENGLWRYDHQRYEQMTKKK